MVQRKPDKVFNGVNVKGKRKVARRTCRDMLTWQHGPLKQAMKGKAELIEGLVVELRLHLYLFAEPTLFSCPQNRCQYQVHRDVGGARNHALKNCVGTYEWTS